MNNPLLRPLIGKAEKKFDFRKAIIGAYYLAKLHALTDCVPTIILEVIKFGAETTA